MPLIVSKNFTVEQEKYIKAALRTLHYGNVSVDNILKNYYSENYEKTMEHNLNLYEESYEKNCDDLKDLYFNYQQETYLPYKSILKNIDFDDMGDSYFYCGMIFKKLDSNFDALRMLIKYDFIYESYAIIRQMVEQIAFAYDVQFRKSVHDFQSPTKSITKLKEFYPKIGMIYGDLSSKTHIDKSQFISYYAVSEEKAGVILRSREESLKVSYDALIMIDLYCCVFENIFNKEVQKFNCLNNDGEILEIRKTRNMVNQFGSKYYTTLKKH